MSDYSELLKDPRWQKCRLKILERDRFTCRACEETEKTLHVHHLQYYCGLKPWEYDNKVLITLCENCHKIITCLGKNNIDIESAYNVIKCINDISTKNFIEWCIDVNKIKG